MFGRWTIMRRCRGFTRCVDCFNGFFTFFLYELLNKNQRYIKLHYFKISIKTTTSHTGFIKSLKGWLPTIFLVTSGLWPQTIVCLNVWHWNPDWYVSVMLEPGDLGPVLSRADNRNLFAIDIDRNFFFFNPFSSSFFALKYFLLQIHRQVTTCTPAKPDP